MSGKCPLCHTRKETPDGMCCNSRCNSGYQYHCENCGIWFIKTFDGRILVDEFLTLVAQPKEVIKK